MEILMKEILKMIKKKEKVFILITNQIYMKEK